FTLGIALLCGLIFGLAPAFQSSGVDLNRALKEASGKASGSGRGARIRKVFVASEIALAVVVLISTTLLVKSFIISVRSSAGFNTGNLMVAQVSLPKTKYAQDSQQRNFSDEVLARIHAIPGVASAGVASAVPFGEFGPSVEVEAVGKPAPQPGEILGAVFTAASPDYFAAMQMHLVKGRTFTSADGPGNAPVALIDQTLARQFWPNEDPIGQKLQFGEMHKVCTIVGIVNDVKMFQLRGRPLREMYVPLAQFPSPTLGFVARGAGNAEGLPAAIRGAIWAVDSDQPVSSVDPMETLMAVQDAGNRVLTKLMVFFGVLALFLCAIGIYGVMAHMVAQRTHEIGIRMALGAQRIDVVRLVMVDVLGWVIIGLGIGAALSLAADALLRHSFAAFGSGILSSLVLAGIALLTVGILAALLPARRAASIEPIQALRSE
ncbi:MAG: ABC transporter permease, partial [Candidatus Acidiferrales bacterium]